MIMKVLAVGDVVASNGLDFLKSNLPALKKDYDAVLVAIGTSVGKKLMYLPGADFKQVYSALEILQAQRLNQPIELGDTVCVIGGGNVAFDAACTLVRMGKTVNVVCLEKNASQASPEERDLGLEEGVNLFDSHSNEAILGTPDQVTGLQVRSSRETAGLGGAALTDWQFLAQFLRTEGDAAVGENIDAITGATVTSKAVVRCVNSAVAYVTGADTASSATTWGG